MPVNTHLKSLGVAAGAALLICGAAVSRRERIALGRQPNQALTVANVGTVDMDLVYAASGAPAAVAAEEDRAAAETAKEIQHAGDAPYLTQQELGEYLTDLQAAAPTPQQQSREKALLDLSNQRSRQLEALSQKKDADLTADDRATMQALEAESRDIQAALPSVSAELQSDARARVEQFRADQMRSLWKAVGTVAAHRGLADVWDRSSLIYSSNDITADAVKAVSRADK